MSSGRHRAFTTIPLRRGRPSSRGSTATRTLPRPASGRAGAGCVGPRLNTRLEGCRACLGPRSARQTLGRDSAATLRGSLSAHHATSSRTRSSRSREAEAHWPRRATHATCHAPVDPSPTVIPTQEESPAKPVLAGSPQIPPAAGDSSCVGMTVREDARVGLTCCRVAPAPPAASSASHRDSSCVGMTVGRGVRHSRHSSVTCTKRFLLRRNDKQDQNQPRAKATPGMASGRLATDRRTRDGTWSDLQSRVQVDRLAEVASYTKRPAQSCR